MSTRTCQRILKQIKKEDTKQGYFLQPVNPMVCEAYDYFDVIKFPMDLSTVHARLNDGTYAKDMNMFISDMFLIFSNAIRYNPASHPVHQEAIKLKDLLCNQIEKEMRYEADMDSIFTLCTLKHAPI